MVGGKKEGRDRSSQAPKKGLLPFSSVRERITRGKFNIACGKPPFINTVTFFFVSHKVSSVFPVTKLVIFVARKKRVCRLQGCRRDRLVLILPSLLRQEEEEDFPKPYMVVLLLLVPRTRKNT